MMNLVDEELLDIEFDVLWNIQIIKRRVWLLSLDLNEFQDLLRIKEEGYL